MITWETAIAACDAPNTWHTLLLLAGGFGAGGFFGAVVATVLGAAKQAHREIGGGAPSLATQYRQEERERRQELGRRLREAAEEAE